MNRFVQFNRDNAAKFCNAIQCSYSLQFYLFTSV